MTNDKQRNIEVEPENWGLWMQTISGNRCLVEHIGKHYRFHAGRLALLRDILGGIENGNEQDIIERIYEYGSMVKRQDLIARQMFLWLLAMAEETASSEKNGVETE